MKNKEFQPGDLVYSTEEYSVKGVFVKYNDPVVKSKNRWYNNNELVTIKWNNEELEDEEVYIGSIKKHDQDLEAEFLTVEEKVKQAVSCLKEANAITRKHKTTVSDLLNCGAIKASGLLGQIDACGWSTSSMNC